MDQIARRKSQLREDIIKDLKKLPKEEFINAGEYILINHLASFILNNQNNYKKAVAFFVSSNLEINTTSLDQFLRLHNIIRCIPYCKNNNKMDFYPLENEQSIENLKKGPLGFKEPAIERTSPILLDKLSIIFVPGLLFDKMCNRLGRGKGHYDRFLANIIHMKNRPILVGLALDKQIVQRLPVNDHDIPMDFVCTKDLGIFMKKDIK